jgi:hypothetical protein
MTKKALIECTYCGWTIEGEVPNDKPGGYTYEMKGSFKKY